MQSYTWQLFFYVNFYLDYSSICFRDYIYPKGHIHCPTINSEVSGPANNEAVTADQFINSLVTAGQLSIYLILEDPLF